MMIPFCVLRSGGDFDASHVQALSKQIPNLHALSDATIRGVRTIPLKSSWQGWWAKMELFRPDIKGDLLYVDLDTIIFDLPDVCEQTEPLLLEDFYWPGKKASGIMFLPESSRESAWEGWCSRPEQWMTEAGRQGDGFVISSLLKEADLWQEKFPEQICSYKVHVQRKGLSSRARGNGSVPQECKVLCFHGKPRPWNLSQFKHLYRC